MILRSPGVPPRGNRPTTTNRSENHNGPLRPAFPQVRKMAGTAMRAVLSAMGRATGRIAPPSTLPSAVTDGMDRLPGVGLSAFRPAPPGKKSLRRRDLEKWCGRGEWVRNPLLDAAVFRDRAGRLRTASRFYSPLTPHVTEPGTDAQRAVVRGGGGAQQDAPSAIHRSPVHSPDPGISTIAWRRGCRAAGGTQNGDGATVVDSLRRSGRTKAPEAPEFCRGRPLGRVLPRIPGHPAASLTPPSPPQPQISSNNSGYRASYLRNPPSRPAWGPHPQPYPYSTQRPKDDTPPAKKAARLEDEPEMQELEAMIEEGRLDPDRAAAFTEEEEEEE